MVKCRIYIVIFSCIFLKPLITNNLSAFNMTHLKQGVFPPLARAFHSIGDITGKPEAAPVCVCVCLCVYLSQLMCVAAKQAVRHHVATTTGRGCQAHFRPSHESRRHGTRLWFEGRKRRRGGGGGRKSGSKGGGGGWSGWTAERPDAGCQALQLPCTDGAASSFSTFFSQHSAEICVKDVCGNFWRCVVL